MFDKFRAAATSPEGYRFEAAAEGNGDYKVKKRSRAANIMFMAVSLVLAFILWLYAISTGTQVVTSAIKAVPITIEGGGSTLSVYNALNSTVDVTIEGTKSELKNVSPADVTAWVDISGINTAGIYTLDVNVSVPDGVWVAEQSVSTMKLRLDNRSTTTVPVKAYINSFMIDSGGEIGSSDMSYDITETVVTGPESVLARITEARLQVSLGKVSNSQTYTGVLELVDSDGKTIRDPSLAINPSSATVTIPVYFKKTVPLKVNYRYGYFNKDTVDVTINPETITIKGETDDLDAISELNLNVIDETKVTTDTVVQKVVMPEGVTNISGTEEAVVSIVFKDTTEKTLVVNNISVNAPDGLNYELLSDSINITVRGGKQFIGYINSRDITASVNLSFLSGSSGETSVPVLVTISDSYKKHVYPVGDYKISVRVN
ncbi:MAG: YbbR-like domain-containing protein [Eubacteriales bacterium]|jgi:YbbR domain-containing protein